MSVIVSRKMIVPNLAPPIGTTWLYENNGTFTVPATGKYQIEMHGGGGGGGGGLVYSPEDAYDFGSGGGGSGELLEVELTKGDSHSIIIGSGGRGGAKTAIYEEVDINTHFVFGGSGSDGGTTYFGNYFIAGGGGGEGGHYAIGQYGYPSSGGAASGNLASAGSYNITASLVPKSYAGGEGNTRNISQTYGDGGASAGGASRGSDGKPGAVIITFMGVA